MKKIVKLLIIGTILLVVVMLLKGPTQDRVSSEYHVWKKQHEELLVTNKSYQAAVLGPGFNFDHLELILVSAGEKYYSRWGHLMLRFAGSGESQEQEDLVLSFLADFNDFPVDNMKASIGQYVVMPKINTLAHYRQEYEKGEGRTMTFYKVTATNEQKRKLLEVLRKWIQEPVLPGGYSFFYNNCVSLMTKLFLESNLLPGHTFYGVWPKYTLGRYAKQGLIKYE